MESSNGYAVGPYAISTPLAKQSEKAVYRAVDKLSNGEVVIRFLVPSQKLSESLLRRFEHSAAALKKLEHPNLVGISDYGVHRGVPYLVSPFVAGGSLRQNLKGALPWAQAARLLTPVAKALTYLHEHHIFHRNIHLQNILMGKSLKVSDAGVAQLVELIDPTGKGMGENFLQKDLHDLAAVFYEMVIGQGIPQEGKKLWLPPSGKAIELPAPVKQVIERALMPAGQSFESMGAFAQALTTLGWGGAASPSQLQPGKPQETAVRSAPVRAVKPAQPRKSRRKSRGWLIPLALLGMAAVMGGFILVNSMHKVPQVFGNPASSPSATDPAVIAVSGEGLPETTSPETAQEAAGVEEAPALTSAPVLLPTPGLGSTLRSPVDGMEMVYVPAGEFRMGSDDRDANESPAHGVYLDAYWVDRTEVTNGMFALCVDAGACNPPVSSGSSQHESYYNNADFADYPVIFVSWDQANDYCQWAGRHLPTEAQWEKAARGTDGRICPWGNTSPAPDRLNFNNIVGDTTQVGSYPAGASPYGTLDMSGNVWEWVADWYSSSFYSQSGSDNPTGPQQGTRYVLRGGSWYYEINYIRAAFRFSANASTTLSDVGFRCVMPAQE